MTRSLVVVCVAIASFVACSANVSCIPTTAQASDPLLFIGGDLGARIDQLKGRSQVKVLWLRRNASAGESLQIQGRRLDGQQQVDLTVPAVSATVPWPGADLAHGYPSDFLLPSRGCWRFSIVGGGPGDMLIFSVPE